MTLSHLTASSTLIEIIGMSEQGSARIWRCSLSFASKQDRVAVLFVALAEWYGVMAGKKKQKRVKMAVLLRTESTVG